MKQVLTAALCAGAALAICTTAYAAPYAPVPPLSKDGKQMLAFTHKSPAKCPDASAVDIPAYPGSLCLGMVTMTSGPASKRWYPRVKIVSTAPLSTVTAWYKSHLGKGWVYDPRIKHFAPPGWSFRTAARTQSVFFQPIDKTHQPMGAAFFKLGDAKTEITITYKPK
jgi:hypothetical protein